MTETRTTLGSCCAATPSSTCFWATVFLVVYGALMLLRSEWAALTPYGDAVLFLALGIACVVNAARNRTYHCYLTAPLFLVAAAVAALGESRLMPIRVGLMWAVVLVGIGVAFAAEWRARRLHQNRRA